MKQALLTLFLFAVESHYAFGQKPSYSPLQIPTAPCKQLPPVDPQKGFLANFNNSCYALPLTASTGVGLAGDLNARYALTYFKVTPGYQLVILGTFPDARFFSVTAYDSHSVPVSRVVDQSIVPLDSTMINPYLPGNSYVQKQQYGVTIGFGGALTLPSAPGCTTGNSNVGSNFLDASQIHQGITWNGYPGLPQGFPVHLTGPNSGGMIMARTYDEISPVANPVVIVRQLSNGCGVPLQIANGTIIATESSTGKAFMDQNQIAAHTQFSTTIEPAECFLRDQQNQLIWRRSTDYIPGNNDDAGYLTSNFSAAQISNVITNNLFIRMRFQIPTTPDTPCATPGCVITGSEQVRYRSVSFQAFNDTLASINDTNLVKDPNGYVTLIVGMGATPPAFVTAANYYTYLDLTPFSNYASMQKVVLRDLLPNASFQCSSFNVPYFTMEYNPQGGYMGNYVPTVDFPSAADLTVPPVPIQRANTCTATVRGNPRACSAPPQ